MKILFNCMRSGMANNGGTKTLLNCQRVIRKLGHKCDIATNSDRFTWFKHPKPIPKLNDNYDAIIATACTTIERTLYKSNIKKKFWYIRGHETWVPNYDEDRLISMYRNKNLIKIVNSKWMYDFLKNLGIKCYYAPQGIDIKDWKNLEIRNDNEKLTIGCIYSNKPSKGWDKFITLSKILGDEYSYVAYGNKAIDVPPFLDEYHSNPDLNTLRYIYSKCNYWFAPSSQEGLHNPPMEAIMCGCKLIRSDHSRCGMQDYSNKYNSIVYNDDNISDAAFWIKEDDKNDNRKQLDLVSNICNIIKDRKSAMKRFLKIIGGCL